VIAATGGGPDDEWIAELAGGLRASCEALIAEIDGRAIGVLQLAACGVGDEGYWDAIAPPGAWAIDIWIGSAEQRGHGYGTEMMRQAADRCFTVHGASELWIDPLVSNTRAIRFYQRLGWEFVAEHRFEGDGDELCAIHRLARPAVG
jgi:aminoglycoside 6'-N-acetyltransferase